MAIMCEEKVRPWQVTCVPQAGGMDSTSDLLYQRERQPVSTVATALSDGVCCNLLPTPESKVRTSELNETPEAVLVRSTGHNHYESLLYCSSFWNWLVRKSEVRSRVISVRG